MKEISIVRDRINIEKLDADLRTTLATDYLGLSTRPGEVLVFMADTTPGADVLQAKDVVVNHDPTQLTPEQQAKMIRQQLLDSARLSNIQALNLADYAASEALIEQLAQKLSWLELELRDLRGLG